MAIHATPRGRFNILATGAAISAISSFLFHETYLISVLKHNPFILIAIAIFFISVNPNTLIARTIARKFLKAGEMDSNTLQSYWGRIPLGGSFGIFIVSIVMFISALSGDNITAGYIVFTYMVATFWIFLFWVSIKL